jgi:hypothetical protein
VRCCRIAGSIGDQGQLFGLAEPVQPLPIDLFPDRVYQGILPFLFPWEGWTATTHLTQEGVLPMFDSSIGQDLFQVEQKGAVLVFLIEESLHQRIIRQNAGDMREHVEKIPALKMSHQRTKAEMGKT